MAAACGRTHKGFWISRISDSECLKRFRISRISDSECLMADGRFQIPDSRNSDAIMCGIRNPGAGNVVEKARKNRCRDRHASGLATELGIGTSRLGVNGGEFGDPLPDPPRERGGRYDGNAEGLAARSPSPFPWRNSFPGSAPLSRVCRAGREASERVGGAGREVGFRHFTCQAVVLWGRDRQVLAV
jgi:hypothetical protein